MDTSWGEPEYVAPAGCPLERRGEHERLEGGAGLAPRGPAAVGHAGGGAAQRVVDLVGGVVAPRDEGAHVARRGLDRDERGAQVRLAALEEGSDLLARRGLLVGVERGLDAQAATEDLVLAAGQVLAEPAPHVVGEVRVGRLLGLRGVHDGRRPRWRSEDGEPDRLGGGLVVGLLADHPLVEHGGEHAQPADLRRGGVDPRAVAARRRDDARQHGGLRQRQLAHRLAEVRLGGGTDAVGALTQVDDRQVLEEDLLLVHLAVELAGEDRLADLALDRALVAGDRVLHELLGDGRAALVQLAAADVGPQRPKGAADVDPAVGVEAAVLRGDHRLLQHLGDVLGLHGDAGLELLERGDLVARRVVDPADLRRRRRCALGEVGGERQEEVRRQHDARRRDGREHGEHDGRCPQLQHASHRTIIAPPRGSGAEGGQIVRWPAAGRPACARTR